MSALDAIFVRRSVRSFTPDTIEASTVRALLDAAVQAPTALHEEPWLFVVVQNAPLLRRLSDLAKESILRDAPLRGGADGAPPAAMAGFLQQLRDPDFNIFYNAGTLILIGARQADPFVVADCWLAAENLMLAACALGLGTCCIGAAVAALNTPAAKADLRIPNDVTVVTPIVVGVPAAVTAAAATAAAASRREPQILAWR